MRRLIISLGLVMGLAACATVPAEMDLELFQAERSSIEANPSVAASETALETMFARTDLSEDQRVDLLYLRADKRWEARFDLPGAIEDLDQVLVLRPEDTRAAGAERRKVFAATEIENAQRRLARLQNLPDWFDDKVLMGDLAAGAERYRAAGLTPSDAQLYLLRESGYVCAAPEIESAAEMPEEAEVTAPAITPVHRHGLEPDYVAGAVWCSDPSLS